MCLLVNKPAGWTSFDIVNKIRSGLKYNLGIKKVKVGHAGTLDPMATGLLIVCTGKHTKKLSEYQGLDKEYTGIITLGATTPSYDAETEMDRQFPYDHITLKMLEQVRQSFVGDIEQRPPMYSAIKVDGQPLYIKARKGITVELEPRPVTIFEFELTEVQLPNVHFRVKCSKGTYIRSLAHDFGNALQSGAYLSELCRTAIGGHQLKDAWDMYELVERIESLTPVPNL
ncbi:MAG: tRNA pseudouridine(55) synthase TruB [Saprospiraceae bacterium]|nr:MAG: tRNA pseudouridine(55) synthase TruB [Saprospiraceae bacterium]